MSRSIVESARGPLGSPQLAHPPRSTPAPRKIRYACPQGCCQVEAVMRTIPGARLSWAIRLNSGARLSTSVLSEALGISTIAITKRLDRRQCLQAIRDPQRIHPNPRAVRRIAELATRFAMLRWPVPERVCAPR